jgi:hypothetical protein
MLCVCVCVGGGGRGGVRVDLIQQHQQELDTVRVHVWGCAGVHALLHARDTAAVLAGV